jgi:internalin A
MLDQPPRVAEFYNNFMQSAVVSLENPKVNEHIHQKAVSNMRNIIIAALLAIFALGASQYPSWQLARTQLVIAEERVREVIASGTNNINLNDLAALRRLPANIDKIPNLKYLRARETNLRDLSGLEGIDTLQELDLNLTQVSDLTPLSGLPNLRLVYLHDTWIKDVDPLTTLPALERLDIGKTQIGSLEPLTRIESLQWLNLNRSHALDGSRDHLEILEEMVFLELSGGSAYRQDYHPDWRYSVKLRLDRLKERLGL